MRATGRGAGGSRWTERDASADSSAAVAAAGDASDSRGRLTTRTQRSQTPIAINSARTMVSVAP